MFALVDCNNFYASCERVFRPELEQKPIVVLSNNDGCVIARSNEAKDAGIGMGAPAFLMEALIREKGIHVFSSNYALYGDMSDRVMRTLATFTPNIEYYSIDEAFLGLTGLQENLFTFGSRMRQTVKQWTGIPVSVGIAPTKTLAKVANRWAKKKVRALGVHVLDTESTIEEALMHTEVEDIWGIGRQHAAFLRRYGIETGFQLRQADDAWIRKHLTVVGQRMLNELRGVSCLALEEVPPAKKGMCNARSFGAPQETYSQLAEAVSTYATRLAEKLRNQGSAASCMQVFLQTNRFKPEEPQYYNSQNVYMPVATNDTGELVHYALVGLKLLFKKGYKYKKAGVFLTGIVPQSQVQKSLFDYEDRDKKQALMQAVDKVNQLMGRDTVRVASAGFDRKWKLRQERLSPCYTTRWKDVLNIKLPTVQKKQFA